MFNSFSKLTVSDFSAAMLLLKILLSSVIAFLALTGFEQVRSIVAEVEFSTWTADKILRHPSFEGLREDKPAAAVVAERPRSR